MQEWNIKGATNHPFHLHVYHFQALSGCGGDFEEGEYYDTMAGSCSVRFDLNAATSSPYEGRTIMHCHILEHEDQGAMTWMDVVGGTLPPTFPSDQGYSEHYPLSADPPAAPSGLSATAVSSSAIDLSGATMRTTRRASTSSAPSTGPTSARSLQSARTSEAIATPG